MIRDWKWVFYYLIVVRNSLCHWKQWTYTHANASGWGAPVKNLSRLIEYANEKLKDINFNEGYYDADFIVRGNCSYLKDLIEDLCRGEKYWGQGCPEVQIVVEDIALKKNSFEVKGKNSDTVKFTFNGVTYIKFKAEKLIEELNRYNGNIVVTVLGTPNVNEWGGSKTMQIKINEIEVGESSEFDF